MKYLLDLVNAKKKNNKKIMNLFPNVVDIKLADWQALIQLIQKPQIQSFFFFLTKKKQGSCS